MSQKFLIMITVFMYISCGNFGSDTIYKTKSGEFASKTGNFIADFPTKPNHSAIDNQIGLDKFELHVFRSSLGRDKVFSVEYVDYPEYMIKSMTSEQLFTQGVTNFSNKVAGEFNLLYQEPIEQHGLNGHAFQLQLKEGLEQNGRDIFIMGSLFLNGNRMYTVTYIGRNDVNIGPFMDSFRLLE